MASNKKKNDSYNRTTSTTASGYNNRKNDLNQVCDMRRFVKEHPLLSKLFREDGVLFECDGEAPSPSKDYGQIQISMDQV